MAGKQSTPEDQAQNGTIPQPPADGGNAEDSNTNDEHANAEADEGSEEDLDEGEEQHPDVKKQKTFTQRQVSAMMTREKKQGRNAAYNELGIDPNDTDTIEIIKAFATAQKQQKEESGEADNEKVAAAEAKARNAEAKVQAMTMGVKPQFVDDVVTLANARADASDDADFKSIIGDMKQKYPDWFGASGDDKSQKGQRGTGASIPSSSGAGNNNPEEGIGKRLAAQRKSRSKKNFSYWGTNKN